jgi:hypothetical protein
MIAQSSVATNAAANGAAYQSTSVCKLKPLQLRAASIPRTPNERRAAAMPPTQNRAE